jgi:hypothetical protein
VPYTASIHAVSDESAGLIPHARVVLALAALGLREHLGVVNSPQIMTQRKLPYKTSNHAHWLRAHPAQLVTASFFHATRATTAPGRVSKTSKSCVEHAPLWVLWFVLNKLLSQKRRSANTGKCTHIYISRASRLPRRQQARGCHVPARPHAAAESVVVALHSGSFCQPPPTRVGRNQ